MKHPVIGKLYLFSPCSEFAVHITPVEYCKAGLFKGALLCYIFKPELSAEELYSGASGDDLLIPAFFTFKEYFKDGSFSYVPADKSVPLPLFRLHGFNSSILRNDYWPKKWYDINRQLIPRGTTPDHFSSGSLSSLPGICKHVAKALNLNIDCDQIYPYVEPDREQVQLPADDHLNKRSMFLVVSIPHDSAACLNPDQDIMGIEDALMAALEPAKLGICDGDEAGENETDLFVKILPRKYPEAILAIRKALGDVGVLRYEVLWIKD